MRGSSTGRRGGLAVSIVFLYLGLLLFGFAVAGAVGLLGDDGRQRVEDLVLAAVSAGVVLLARRSLVRRSPSSRPGDE